eukprot:748649-Alexandrium_andersonii.AAC.1
MALGGGLLRRGAAELLFLRPRAGDRRAPGHHPGARPEAEGRAAGPLPAHQGLEATAGVGGLPLPVLG